MYNKRYNSRKNNNLILVEALFFLLFSFIFTNL